MERGEQMTINGIKIDAKEFAWDGCHKIYLLESNEDRYQAIKTGYEKIFPISKLEYIYQISCPLRFIRTWGLESVVDQGETAIFEN